MSKDTAIANSNKVVYSSFIKLCAAFDLFLISFTFFQWDLVEIFTPFLLPFLLLSLWAILGILTLISAISAPFDFRIYSWKSFLPIIINGSTLLILLYVPFTTIRLSIEFTMNRNGYEYIIQMVESGQLKPNEYGRVELPPDYRYLSKGGGDIMVDTSDGITSIFFYTYRGVLDNFSGYMYRSNDTHPIRDFMGGDWAETTRKDRYWYFCASL
jgi:hypothetical protein